MRISKILTSVVAIIHFFVNVILICYCHFQIIKSTFHCRSGTCQHATKQCLNWVMPYTMKSSQAVCMKHMKQVMWLIAQEDFEFSHYESSRSYICHTQPHCWDSSVRIVTRLWIGWLEFNSQQGQVSFLFVTMSRVTLGTTHLPSYPLGTGLFP